MHYFIEHPSEELKLLVWILAARRKYKLINELQQVIDQKIIDSQSNTATETVNDTNTGNNSIHMTVLSSSSHSSHSIPIRSVSSYPSSKAGSVDGHE